jgi:uncharacterized protein (DUF2344 family)
MPIYAVEDVPVTHPSATKSLARAEYLLTVDMEVSEEAATHSPEWASWLQAVVASDRVDWQHTTKSGKKQTVNLRDRLFSLALVKAAEFPEVVWRSGTNSPTQAILYYEGSCRNDGTLLRPEHLVYMLEQVAAQPLRLVQIHRLRLILEADPTGS